MYGVGDERVGVSDLFLRLRGELPCGRRLVHVRFPPFSVWFVGGFSLVRFWSSGSRSCPGVRMLLTSDSSTQRRKKKFLLHKTNLVYHMQPTARAINGHGNGVPPDVQSLCAQGFCVLVFCFLFFQPPFPQPVCRSSMHCPHFPPFQMSPFNHPFPPSRNLVPLSLFNDFEDPLRILPQKYPFSTGFIRVC